VNKIARAPHFGNTRYQCERAECSARNKVNPLILKAIEKGETEFPPTRNSKRKSKEVLRYFWTRYPLWKILLQDKHAIFEHLKPQASTGGTN
jgi:hypothetical protein